MACYYSIGKRPTKKNIFSGKACYSDFFNDRSELLSGRIKFKVCYAGIRIDERYRSLSNLNIYNWLTLIKNKFGGIEVIKKRNLYFESYFADSSIHPCIVIKINPYNLKCIDKPENIYITYKVILTLIRYLYEDTMPQLIIQINKYFNKRSKYLKDFDKLDLLINTQRIPHLYKYGSTGHGIAHIYHSDLFRNNYIKLDLEKFLNSAPVLESHEKDSRPYIGYTIPAKSLVITDTKVIKALDKFMNKIIIE